jgi:hypothetical protein
MIESPPMHHRGSALCRLQTRLQTSSRSETFFKLRNGLSLAIMPKDIQLARRIRGERS